jgi:choline dehydrogenase-like flavoprotein
VKANKEAIVSAGAIGSPKLLQLSGIGPASILQNANISVVVDLPGVGTNYRQSES